MNKKLLFLLTAHVVLLHASDKAKDKDEGKSAGTKTTTRWIIMQNVEKPSCPAEKRQWWTNKKLLQESDTLIKKYAPIFPAFAALPEKKHGCNYSLSQRGELKVLANGTTYQKISATCCECLFKATFFHIPLVTGVLKNKCGVTCANASKKTTALLPDELQRLKELTASLKRPFSGIITLCNTCNTVEFVMAKEPELAQKLAAPPAKKQEETDNEIWV